MHLDKDTLLALTQNSAQKYVMRIKGVEYSPKEIQLSYVETPVSRPTTRGGVYFSDKMGFKIKVNLADTGLSSSLSKMMLGPNADFEQIQFLTQLNVGGTTKKLKIFANLVNYVQKSDGLELNLMVVGTESTN
ncbi:MAG: hypothetical protein AB1299_06135 [Thermoproteota archaeon]|nr:hypothetical protein [Candidatus Nitrosotenuis sp.]